MIITTDELKKLRELHRDKKVVLVSGVFDLLHYGHVQYLQAAKELGDVVVAMVKSDERVQAGKGPQRPILPQADRVRMVDAVKGVDYAFVAPHRPFHGKPIDPTYELVFAQLEPDIFYSANQNWKQLEALGIGKVIIAERYSDSSLSSTTDIISQVMNKQKGTSK